MARNIFSWSFQPHAPIGENRIAVFIDSGGESELIGIGVQLYRALGRRTGRVLATGRDCHPGGGGARFFEGRSSHRPKPWV